MHIMEGFFQAELCAAWCTFSILAVAAGFVFVLSALKLPSVTGSCSHPTDTISTIVALTYLSYKAFKPPEFLRRRESCGWSDNRSCRNSKLPN